MVQKRVAASGDQGVHRQQMLRAVRPLKRWAHAFLEDAQGIFLLVPNINSRGFPNLNLVEALAVVPQLLGQTQILSHECQSVEQSRNDRAAS